MELTSWPYIGLYGDSLAMPRPGVVTTQQRYIQQVRAALMKERDIFLDLRDRSEPSATITMEAPHIVRNDAYFQDQGVLAVLHCGVVDCAPRPVSPKMRKRISRLPPWLMKRVTAFLHRNRARILRRRFYVTTEFPEFSRKYAESVQVLRKSHQQVFCINICPAPPSYEAKCPGIGRQITAYNAAIEAAVTQQQDQEVHLVDLHRQISSSADIYDYIVRDDDHHITPKAHDWIASTILSQIRR